MHYRTLTTDRDGHVTRHWESASTPDEAALFAERRAAGRLDWLEITVLDEDGHTVLSVADEADTFADCEYRA